MKHDLPQDLYARLNVKPDVDNKGLEGAYKKMLRTYHPDVNPANPTQAHENFLAIKEAYQVLSNSSLRRQYDATRIRDDAEIDELMREFSRRRESMRESNERTVYDSEFRKTYIDPFFDDKQKDYFDNYFDTLKKDFFKSDFKIKDDD